MDEQDYILIERYLQRDLVPEEMATVEQRIAGEPGFAVAVEGRRQLNVHLRATAGETVLRPTLERLGGQYFPEKREAVVRPMRSRRWLYGVVAAAVIALAVILSGPWLFPSGGYDQFAQHEPLSLTERSTAPGSATVAEEAYNSGRYAEAVPLLEGYLELQAEDERARLALGVSLLETDRDQEAIAVFKSIAEGQSSLAPYGNWYLALAAVKRGDNAAAKRFLDLLPASDTFLINKAKALRATL